MRLCVAASVSSKMGMRGRAASGASRGPPSWTAMRKPGGEWVLGLQLAASWLPEVMARRLGGSDPLQVLIPGLQLH